jgi:hypothetical protein
MKEFQMKSAINAVPVSEVKPSFLATLLAEISAVEVPEGWDPQAESEVEESDTPIGTVSEYAQKISFLHGTLADKHNARAEALNAGLEEPTDEAVTSMLKMEALTKLLDLIFWEQVRTELPGASSIGAVKHGIELRSGWQVVELPCNCAEKFAATLSESLSSMFGGGRRGRMQVIEIGAGGPDDFLAQLRGSGRRDSFFNRD